MTSRLVPAVLGVLLPFTPTRAQSPESVPAGPTVETLVIIRHGEKPKTEIGQLDIQGLNRSLALPQILTSKFGIPQFIFAPDPAHVVGHKKSPVCYIRPLATIEPTAISCGLPVNTLFGYEQIQPLEEELEKPDYWNALVFIAWEHGKAEELARDEVRSHGGKGDRVPDWDGSDFDSIYLVKITRQPGQVSATFTLDHEGLAHPSLRFPSPAAP